MRKMNLNDDIDILEEERIEQEYRRQQEAQERHRKQNTRDYYEHSDYSDYAGDYNYSRRNKRRNEHPSYNYSVQHDNYYNDSRPRRRPIWGGNRLRNRDNIPYNRRSDFAFRGNRGWNSSGWGRRTNREGSGQVIFYIILFIALAVLFKWVILKNAGMTTVATLIVIVVFMGHLRDK